jgi:hypothetical protein
LLSVFDLQSRAGNCVAIFYQIRAPISPIREQRTINPIK